MNIQWFPGHMNKALNMMYDEVKVIDVIIYVLDSRAPYSCLNPEFTKLIKEKPIIYALNKSDITDQIEVKKWAKYFTKANTSAVILNSTMSGSSSAIINEAKKLLKDKIAKYAAKNIIKPIRLMVLGVPNSGKSTLINNLCGKYKAITGNKPGVTLGKQWVMLPSGIEVMDTPGTLWPSFENKHVAKNLAYIGSIKDDIMDITELSLDFIDQFKNTNIFTDRYGVENLTDKKPYDILNEICIKRGFILKGGQPDTLRGANAVIEDFRKGRLGRIILEKTEDLKLTV